jgi:hypothetical protein
MADIQTGIYLEVKKGVIGTGHTAKSAEYRNFWMTLAQEGDQVHCVLLNQDFQLTGLNETFTTEDFESGRLTYIPQGEKRYQILLRELLEIKLKQKKKAPPAADPSPTAAKPKEEPKAKKWWEGEQKSLTAEDIFGTRVRTDKPEEAEPKPSGNWWEASRTVSPPPAEKKPEAKKKKPSEVTLKKSWYDK